MKVRTQKAAEGIYDVLYLRPEGNQTRGRYRRAGHVEHGSDGWGSYDIEARLIGANHKRKRDAVESVIAALDQPQQDSRDIPEAEAKQTEAEYKDWLRTEDGSPPPAPPQDTTPFLVDVKRSAAFEKWLATQDLTKLSIYEAFKAGIDYARGQL